MLRHFFMQPAQVAMQRKPKADMPKETWIARADIGESSAYISYPMAYLSFGMMFLSCIQSANLLMPGRRWHAADRCV